MQNTMLHILKTDAKALEKILQQYKSSYKSESRTFPITVEKS